MNQPECPDGGACHHGCNDTENCFRVEYCEPLSGIYPDNKWPRNLQDELTRKSREYIKALKPLPPEDETIVDAVKCKECNTRPPFLNSVYCSPCLDTISHNDPFFD